MNQVLSWWAGGIGIGLVSIVAVALVQPIGVSAQYVVLDGVLLHSVLPDVASKSPYLAKTAEGWTLADFFRILLGVYLLDLFGLANMKVKELYLLGLVIAGAIFGVGFALTGYCPGTALAACAEGKPDAWVTVMGGLCGALVFAFLFPAVEESLLTVGRYGPVTIPDLIGIHGIWIAAPLGIVCIWLAMGLPEQGGAR